MSDDYEHTIKLKIRHISNGYVVTGHVEKGDGVDAFPEEFYPDLAALDMAISKRLAEAERMADAIEQPEMPRHPLISFWGTGRSGDDE